MSYVYWNSECSCACGWKGIWADAKNGRCPKCGERVVVNEENEDE